VRENVESTRLQYDLAKRAELYGWPAERIDVIDDDLGVSGKSLEGRSGFQRLLAEISLGHVGIVMGIEMSRLARNCRDWHQLLELCAVFGSLLGDADGIYNPREHNDRLLLGLKGTMSEAELHVLRSRLDSGKKNKARRGEYYGEAPMGYVRSRDGFAIEPDAQAQGVLRMIFEKFVELGSAHAVLRYLHEENIKVGRRVTNGPRPGELTWLEPNRSTLTYILRHPIYAGAYVFGRTKSVTTSTVNGGSKTVQRQLPQDEWSVLIKDHVPAYITWEQWEANQKKLRENSTKFGFGATGGSSLLAGRIYCGKCGARMPVHYRDGIASFDCSIARMHLGRANCQSFNTRWLEPMIDELVVEALSPASIDLSLTAVESIEADRAQLETHHKQSVERVTYEAEVAQRRFKEVDPCNRLVAAELEKEWEVALIAQRKSEESLNRFRQERPSNLSAQERTTIASLSDDIPLLWKSDSTSNKDRQDLVRILIEKIVVETFEASERLTVTIHWSGGFQSRHETRRTVSTFDELEDSDALYRRAIELYNSACPREELIASLNNEGFRPARKERFTLSSINALILVLRRKGLIGSKPCVARPEWRSSELAHELGIKPSTLTGWHRRGWVQSTKLGFRRIYWANEIELNRLKKLAAYQPNWKTPTPPSLTSPAAKMP
jgi:DNA invertase Pin-like site-specific DNA recombinase